MKPSHPLLLLTMGAAALTFAPAVAAQTVTWGGAMGDRVALVIDGQVRVASAGSVFGDLRVHRVTASDVEYEVAGVRQRLAAGGAPVAVGSGARAPASLQLQVGADRLYHVEAKVNGRVLPAVVDTGASLVTLSVEQARSLGLDWQRGQPTPVQTANGRISGWSLRLARLAVGPFDLRDVEAVVLETDLPHLLVGNSFLRRFQVTQREDQMTLSRHP
jgi:aspartyl protease family protein